MPFTARCVRCGYIVMANTRKMLNLKMEDHDSQSHNLLYFDFRTWTIAVLNNEEYGMLVQASKLPAFWNAILCSPKK